MGNDRTTTGEERSRSAGAMPGIVIADGRGGGQVVSPGHEPRIVAFIWGGKVRPPPTLPYGRWKGAA